MREACDLRAVSGRLRPSQKRGLVEGRRKAGTLILCILCNALPFFAHERSIDKSSKPFTQQNFGPVSDPRIKSHGFPRIRSNPSSMLLAPGETSQCCLYKQRSGSIWSSVSNLSFAQIESDPIFHLRKARTLLSNPPRRSQRSAICWVPRMALPKTSPERRLFCTRPSNSSIPVHGGC